MTDPNKPRHDGPDPANPVLPDIEGTPLPDELTGRASKTDDDLASLFGNESEEHIKDGFRGGSGEGEEEEIVS